MDYIRRRYLFMVTDPVHVGTGGYRLGRVDNSIVREPGTRIPKIPGSSLHGAARAYAARLYETPEAAGQEHGGVSEPDKNPVCYTFGYIARGEKGEKAFSGVVSVFDAHILAFPVYSLAGPVWVTTCERLKDAGFNIEKNGKEVSPEDVEEGAALLGWGREGPLNLGWLMVGNCGQMSKIEVPGNWSEQPRWKRASSRIAVVQEALFSHVVNSNLEVRTSVAIDPETGAAKEKALFTYEAIPRATFLTAEVVLDDYRGSWPLSDEKQQTVTSKGTPLPGGKGGEKGRWAGPLDVVDAGLRMIEWLGVGGMGTRGFGRMAVVGDPVDEHLLESRGGE